MKANVKEKIKPEKLHFSSKLFQGGCIPHWGRKGILWQEEGDSNSGVDA